LSIALWLVEGFGKPTSSVETATAGDDMMTGRQQYLSSLSGALFPWAVTARLGSPLRRADGAADLESMKAIKDLVANVRIVDGYELLQLAAIQ